MTETPSTLTASRPRMQAPATAVAATSGAAFDEAVTLTRKLKLPHIRRALAEIIPVAKTQRWDPAEVVRALLAEEAAGCDASNLRTRRQRAAFPTGKTFHIWNEATDLPADVFGHQLRAIAEGRLKVPVAKVYHGLEQVRDAQAHLESGTTPGKHVVVLDD